MSLREHRTGRRFIRIRHQQPDFVRKAGPHRERFIEPDVCDACYGAGFIPVKLSDPIDCPECGGEGVIDGTAT